VRDRQGPHLAEGGGSLMDGRENTHQIRLVPPGRRAMSLIVLFAVLALLIVVAPDFLLVIFAGLLFGVFFG
jgi:hypothetical protein